MGKQVYNRICKECGGNYTCKSYYQVYCSKVCAGKGRIKDGIENWLKGITIITERPILKKYLTILNGYKCGECGIFEWNRKPLSLHLDHIDGDASNNIFENLRFLCPNCHSQTEFYAGRNRGNGRKAKGFKIN